MKRKDGANNVQQTCILIRKVRSAHVEMDLTKISWEFVSRLSINKKLNQR